MWDPIMAVGKTPQVTESLAANPITSQGDEITQGLYLTLSGQYDTLVGSVLAVTDPFFDYVGSDAMVWTNKINASNTSDTVTLTIDLGKLVYLRGITLYMVADTGGNANTTYFYLEGTQDGTTWTSLDEELYAGNILTNQEITLQCSQAYARTLRLRCEYQRVAGVTTVITTKIKKLRVWLDSKQSFY